MLQEYIPLGQRVKAFSIYYQQGTNWVRLDPKEETATIGYKRMLRFDKITQVYHCYSYPAAKLMYRYR